MLQSHLERNASQVSEGEPKNWDLHIPKVLLPSMSLQVILLIKLILDNWQIFSRCNARQGSLTRKGEEKEVPDFVEDMNCSLKGVYDDVRWKLNKADQRNKSKYDKKVTGSNLTVGDRVWVYVPAVKQERTRKLSSLWCGPYTIIDRVGVVTYQIQKDWISKDISCA